MAGWPPNSWPVRSSAVRRREDVRGRAQRFPDRSLRYLGHWPRSGPGAGPAQRGCDAARFADRSRQVYVLTWLLTLLRLLFPNNLPAVQPVEDFLVNLLAVTSRNPVDALLGFAYALVGVLLGCLLIGRSARRLYLPSLTTVAALVLLNWAMLFVFVFWSRFAV